MMAKIKTASRRHSARNAGGSKTRQSPKTNPRCCHARFKPLEIRYALRIQDNGTRTVFDTFTDKSAEIGDRLTTEMQMNDAEEIMEVLNLLHPANDNGTIH